MLWRQTRPTLTAAAFCRYAQSPARTFCAPRGSCGVCVHERAQQTVGNQFRRQRLTADVSLPPPHALDGAMQKLASETTRRKQCPPWRAPRWFLRLPPRGVESVVAYTNWMSALRSVPSAQEMTFSRHFIHLRSVCRLRRLDGGIDRPRRPDSARAPGGVNPSG